MDAMIYRYDFKIIIINRNILAFQYFIKMSVISINTISVVFDVKV